MHVRLEDACVCQRIVDAARSCEGPEGRDFDLERTRVARVDAG
jgi:hypothetical protein